MEKEKEKISIMKFSFNEVSLKEIEDYLKDLNPRKACPTDNIPPKYLKENYDICSNTIMQLVNETIKDCTFPNRLKLADLTPTHKQGEKICEKNYRPISILPTLSKIYERVLQRQVNTFMHEHLSNFLCGYRKGYNPQHVLVTLIEKWKEVLIRGSIQVLCLWICLRRLKLSITIYLLPS